MSAFGFSVFVGGGGGISSPPEAFTVIYQQKANIFQPNKSSLIN